MREWISDVMLIAVKLWAVGVLAILLVLLLPDVTFSLARQLVELFF